jgi:hypothetical protein
LNARTARSRFLGGLLLAGSALGCDVPAPPASTGGVPELADAAPGACGRGFSVIESDYQSVNVALVNLAGQVLSESLTTSAVLSHGASTSLSGDVVLPNSPSAGRELPLLDRSAAAPRIAWVDLSSGVISRTLAVDTGFPSNPHDLLVLSPTKAYVARFGHNRDAGKQAFDQGSDLLVVDPRANRITGSIDLRPALGADQEQNLPRPGRLAQAQGFVYALLEDLPVNGFTPVVPSRLAMIDSETDSVRDVLVLDELRGCGGLLLSPSANQLAVLCSALSDSKGASQTEFSGIALVSLGPTPRLEKILRPGLWGGATVGSSGAYADERTLLVTTFGRFSETGVAEAQDLLLRLDLSRPSASVLLESDQVPFTLGDVACAPECRSCLVADAGRDGGVVHHYDLDDHAEVIAHAPVKLETRIGLPPRSVGRF